MYKTAMKDDKQPVRKSSFWGIRCESGKKYSQIVNQKYHISMAALDPTSVKSGKEVVSLVVERDGSEFLLCNLQKDSVLQVNLNLFFDKGEKVVFSLKGQGIVHLTGYLIKDDNDQSDGPLQSKTLNDSIMLAKDKVKASGGANKNIQSKKLSAQNDSWKVESKAEIATPSKKLFASPPEKNGESFQMNNTGILEGDVWNVESEEGITSASPMKNNASPNKKSPSQKTPQKKLFGSSKEESEDSSDDEDDDDDSDDDDEVSDDNDDAQQLLRFAQKRPVASLDDDDDDDDDDEDDLDFEIDSSDESDEDYELPAKKSPGKDEQSAKKLKVDTSTPLPGKKPQKSNVTEVIELDDDSKNGEMNSSIGRTPMPKKKSQSLLQKSALSDSKKAQPSKNEDSSDSDDEMETSPDNVKKADKNKSTSQLNTSSEVPSSEKKKKKKKKKKSSADDSTAANQSNVSVNDSVKAGGGDLSKVQYNKKLPGGVEYTDIRAGNGPEAKKGKLAHVYYIGKLADGKVFDARQAGSSKPFIFKLGAGDVIKGWDLAMEGMKVGGKRRIKIPPHLGYKNVQAGDIPPNSTLHFVVELKAVS